MTETILSIEPVVRLGSFVGIFAVIALWEICAPRRRLAFSRWARWPSNLGVAALNTVVLRFLTPTAAAGLAFVSAKKDWGLLNQIDLPPWAAVVISVVVLDFVIYLQHVVFHAVPVLWRVHRMHHADLDFDVTTGARFHPIEILVSMGIKLGAVLALGPPAAAVVIFEVLLNASSMFNHGNVRLPLRIDRVLRGFLVTPDMHRVHHSIIPSETNSNFGFNLPWWDRLLGTYRAEPEAGYEAMTIGIEQFRTVHDLRLDRMLLQPFRIDSGDDSLNLLKGGPHQ